MADVSIQHVELNRMNAEAHLHYGLDNRHLRSLNDYGFDTSAVIVSIRGKPPHTAGSPLSPGRSQLLVASP